LTAKKTKELDTTCRQASKKTVGDIKLGTEIAR
jgi:hypothetical protein